MAGKDPPRCDECGEFITRSQGFKAFAWTASMVVVHAGACATAFAAKLDAALGATEDSGGADLNDPAPPQELAGPGGAIARESPLSLAREASLPLRGRFGSPGRRRARDPQRANAPRAG